MEVFNLLQHPLSGNQHIGILHDRLVAIFDADFPFPTLLLPDCLLDAMIESDVTIEVPLLHRIFDMLLNLRPSGVVVVPVRLGIEWERLIKR